MGHSTSTWNKTSASAEGQQAWLPEELTAESTADHFLKTASKVCVTKSPGALLPSQHKILPTPDLDFAKDSDEQGLTEGHHAHPCAALDLLLLPWCQHIFIDDNSREALARGGRAQTGSPCHQPCSSMAASSREPARLHRGSSILWYSRRLQQRQPSNLYTRKSLRNRARH